MPPEAADGQLRAATQASWLSNLPDERLQWLLEDAFRMDIPTGSVVYREGDSPRLALVLDGLIRVFLTSSDGRQVTVRYVRRGSMLGVAAAVVGPVDVGVQALTSTSILENVSQSSPDFGGGRPCERRVALPEAPQALDIRHHAFAGNAFGSIRQRIARHLLDLAAEHLDGTNLVARVSQQDLADAVGSVHEVVARVLRDLRDEMVLDVTRQGIVIQDPSRLSDEIDAPVPTKVTPQSP